MNVLFLSNHKAKGGLVKHIGLLAKGLTKYEQDNVYVGISSGEGAVELSQFTNVINISFGTKNPFKIIGNLAQITSLVKKYNIDIIHAQNRFPALYASIICLAHKKVKYIWSNHQVPIPCGFIHRMFTKYGYCAVAEGLEGQKLLIDGLRIPRNKTKVVNLGIELDQFTKSTDEEQNTLKKSLHINDNEKVLMLYGRLAESKGHLFLLDSLHKASATNFKLILPGSDCEFKNVVMHKAEEYGFANNLIFPGFVSGKDYLSISDLVLLPSMNEGFPQACIEAYAIGVPVIRTKTGGFEDTKDMCWGVDYGDVDSFSKLLSDYFSNQIPFKEKANYAKEAVQRLSIKAMSDNYQTIYQEALNK